MIDQANSSIEPHGMAGLKCFLTSMHAGKRSESGDSSIERAIPSIGHSKSLIEPAKSSIGCQNSLIEQANSSIEPQLRSAKLAGRPTR
ncbi:hypothetical protein [Bacillus sp. P14.5]|uniref:hypothetical protein n=1 Tax=Bacillus sp. P14.5 TaxID=1983400 RepID=UPI0013B04F19|nr:hypothetical protein [Bacillus sp. P14.5]